MALYLVPIFLIIVPPSDGTLVTQRFHFAQAPHSYRHVLGWYRLARELNEANVSAICVFDGKERNLAKAPEVCQKMDC
jgi:flap endonuclease-1